MSLDLRIEVSNLSKIYGKFKAVDNISFNIEGSGATIPIEVMRGPERLPAIKSAEFAKPAVLFVTPS